jgi:hypothetical protein
MEPIPPRDSYRIFLPGGLPVLRAAVEEVLRSRWDDIFRRRALEIAVAFEGSFRASGQEELARTAHSVTLLLEIEPREVVLLGKHLDNKLDELLGKLESRMGADGDVKTGT